MNAEKDTDIDEDVELAALREAALASLKSRAVKSTETISTKPNHIAPINTVVASTGIYSGSYEGSEQSNYSNQYWRNHAQPSRRGRGSRSFPKVSQRSNLIVITPVNTEGKKLEERSSGTQLLLPQHKWCPSANEDSCSPKTYRRTGPTRFNRHGSDSSDSDYDNSDNDSYSNETILQDEPSDHFTGQSPNETVVDESSPEKSISDRRLSFQNIDSNLNLEGFQTNESTSVYKCLKSTYPSKSSEEMPAIFRSSSIENDSERSWKHNSRTNYSYTGQYDHATIEIKNSEQTDFSHSENPQTVSSTVNGGTSPKKYKLSSVLSPETDSNRLSRKCTKVPQEDNSCSDSHSKRNLKNNDHSKLSEGDLRLELKKRMILSKSGKSQSSKKQSESPDSQSEGRSRSRNRSHLESRRSPDCNESRNHIYSSSQKYVRSRSRSANGHHSPNHDRHRRQSLDRYRRHDHNQSLVQDHEKDRSGHRNLKRHSSPIENRKQDQSLSQTRKSYQNSSHYHRDRSHSSSSSSSSSTSTSSSGSSSNLPMRSVSSVIKPAQPQVGLKPEKSAVNAGTKTPSSSDSDSVISAKRSKKHDKSNSVTSSVKSSVFGGENRNNVSDSSKRVPVHMRLGTLPGKRVIQMTKDVEAAFVNSSSDDADDDSNMRCKKENFRVVYDINDSKSEDTSKRHIQRNSIRSSMEARRIKLHR